MCRLVRATAPELAVPFAGPPCFLDDDLRKYNESLRDPGIFPDVDQAREWLAEHLPQQRWASFRPGDTVDLSSGDVECDPVSATFSYTEDLDAYLSRYADDRRNAIASVSAGLGDVGPDLAVRFGKHFSDLGTLSPYFLTRIGMTVRFEVAGPHGGNWDVRMDESGLAVDLTGSAAEPEYTFTVEGRWLNAVLTSQIGWEDLLLSLRLSARRNPDQYNDYLIGLLKHANEPALRAVEDYETGRDTDERITVTDAAFSYEIGRYCPHAGEDLTVGAIVSDGVLRCLAHNFEFDLNTGACRNARCEPLVSKRLSVS
ncbi:MAG TPA: Rieske 2Fe-2S domain-containing protein [Micromonosporaceae bacterium]